jgi:hypothetical protein
MNPGRHRFSQIDVFRRTPLRGNPLAVVHAVEGLSNAQMQAFARWTNLSETTFLLQPTDPSADYRVRIFTPGRRIAVRRPSDAGQLPHLAGGQPERRHRPAGRGGAAVRYRPGARASG